MLLLDDGLHESPCPKRARATGALEPLLKMKTEQTFGWPNYKWRGLNHECHPETAR